MNQEQAVGSRQGSFKQRMASGEILSGTFLKTPSYELVEVLALSGLDFIAIDAEHAPFDRARLDACLAIGAALDFPILVRVPDSRADNLLMVLDSGATGVIVPHVDSVEKAANIARWARFGHGGRGYAGSTRWAGFATRSMPELLSKSADETVVIAQIEEPEGVEACEAIAGTEGVDGLFAGPADLAVCFGKTDMNDPAVRAAMKRAGDAAKSAGKCYMTFAASTAVAAELRALGVTMFFVGSEHALMLAGARQVARELKTLETN